MLTIPPLFNQYNFTVVWKWGYPLDLNPIFDDPGLTLWRSLFVLFNPSIYESLTKKKKKILFVSLMLFNPFRVICTWELIFNHIRSTTYMTYTTSYIIYISRNWSQQNKLYMVNWVQPTTQSLTNCQNNANFYKGRKCAMHACHKWLRRL